VVAILLALISAVSYGCSDFAAGLATRRASVLRVTLISEAATVAVVGSALAVIGANPPDLRAVVWGCVAGLGGVCGALALYVGFRHAAFSVAGPLSAVGAAGFSVLAGLLLGERPTVLALTGIVLALPAIVAVSASVGAGGGEHPGGGVVAAPAASDAAPGSPAVSDAAPGSPAVSDAAPGSPAVSDAAPGSPGASDAAPGSPGASDSAPGSPGGWVRRLLPAGVSYGLVAGACFALLFIGLNQAGSGSGLWPVFLGQIAALLAVSCAAAFTGDLRLPEERGGWLAAAAGLTGGPGTILFFVATHRGLLAVAAVITSLYPAVTILLARVVLGERLTAIRLAGLTLAAASVALIAASGAG
jgi:drug/metabolite transporter (DMT)-like permease